MLDEKILIEAIKDHAKKVGLGNSFAEAGYQLAHEHIIDIIHILQIKENQKVNHAKWKTVWVLSAMLPDIVECTNCGNRILYDHDKKCLKCGAIMDGKV